MLDKTLANLEKAVLAYDADAAQHWAEEAIRRGVDPTAALDVLTGAIRQVGDAFGEGELWLPDLVGASAAMQAAMPILEAKINRSGATKTSLGTVVIGTVQGDIHSIGKTMVTVMLTAEGFTVQDLGVNISAGEFVAAAKKHRAHIVAMSAIMTMAAPEMRRVIALLKEAGIRDQVKVMVGGAALNEDFARNMGADGYDPTAPGAAKLARALVQSLPQREES